MREVAAAEVGLLAVRVVVVWCLVARVGLELRLGLSHVGHWWAEGRSCWPWG